MTRVLPMFPLGTVLFPYGLLPLHVFEPRYRVMMRHCMENDHEFGVVLIERGSEVGGGDARFDVATLARIIQITELPDGRYALTVVGVTPLRVEAWLPDDPYPRAEVAEIPEPELGEDERAVASEARARVVAHLRELFGLWAEVEPRAAEIDVQLTDDPARAAFEAASLAPVGPLDAQRVLAAGSPLARLQLLDELVADQIELFKRRDLDGG